MGCTVLNEHIHTCDWFSCYDNKARNGSRNRPHNYIRVCPILVLDLARLDKLD